MAQESFEQLLNAVKQAESRGQRFDEKGNLLTSPKGAQGEMQVMPKTARSPGYGVAPAQDKTPDELARVGKDYLQAMLNKYGDTKTALMAYNWGPKNTDNWLAAGADPKKVPAETQKYTKDILNSLGGTKTAGQPAAEPTASEKMMTDALRSGMSAQNLVKDAGPGYKAAMAMMFLSEDKPKSEEDDIWKEAEPEQVAEEALPSPLEGLDLSYKTPFAAMQPVERQQIAHFASGGLAGAPKVGVKGTARDALDAVKAEYDRYATEAGNYNTALGTYKTETYAPYVSEVDNYNAALEKYKTETYNPYVESVKTYNAGLDKYKQDLYNPYLSEVEKYNNALNAYKTSTYDPYLSEVEKYNTALGQYKTQTYDPYSTALDKYNAALAEWNAGPRTTAFAQTAPTLAKTFDMTAPTAPAAFTGTVPTAPEAFAQTAPAAPTAFSVKAPTLAKTFDMTAPTAPTTTQADYDKMVAAAQMDVQQRQKALDVASNPEAYGLTINKLFSHGGVVHRADGSPMGGENVDHLTPQEIERMAEAQSAAFMSPKSGIGRVAGPISQALASGEAYPAMARGVAETPYNVVGAPVDLATLAMRPFGYKEEKPVMGSDWIKEKMTKYGIRPGEEANPTLQGFRTAGELGASVVNPGPVAAKVGQAAEKGAAAVGKEAARQALRGMEGEGMLAPISPPIMYAVKPTGGAYLAQHMDSNMGDYVKNLESLAQKMEPNRPELAEFLRNKTLPYLTKNYATTNDPVRNAILSGEMGLSPFDAKNFPERLIMDASKGDKKALQELERAHDVRAHLLGTVYDLSPNAKYISSDNLKAIEKQKMIEQGYPAELSNPKLYFMDQNDARQAASNAMSDERYFGQLGMSPSYNGTPEGLKYSLANKQPVYDMSSSSPVSLDYMSPENVVAAIASVDPKKLKNSSFADALIQGNNAMYSGQYKPFLKKTEEWYDAVDKGDVAVARQYPKEEALFGMSDPVVSDSKGFTWRKVIDPDATRIQSQLMNHSIEGYAFPKPYPHSGSAKIGSDNARRSFLKGDVELYSLYNPEGQVVTNLEYLPNHGREIFQARGNGVLTANDEPVNYADQVFDLIEHLDPAEISNSVKALMRANNKFAQGGAVDKANIDHRKYM